MLSCWAGYYEFVRTPQLRPVVLRVRRPNNMGPAVQLYKSLITAAEASGKAFIRGLATDIANYTPLLEPYLSSSNQAVLSSSFYQCANCLYVPAPDTLFLSFRV